MSLNALSVENFLNMESELDYLKGLPSLKVNSLGGNVFLQGAPGAGKTEILKQHYRALFRENDAVPFYYCFKTANLKGSYFARDYFTSFVRQYISFLKKDPTIAENSAEPLQRILPFISSLGLRWLTDSIEDMQAHISENDVYWQMVAAISIPALAAQRGSRPVVVMLDDFDAAERLYECSMGDRQGLVSLFGEPMNHKLCPYVLTGATGTIADIFTDQTFTGMTEQLRISPLPEDVAFRLFRNHLANLKISCTSADALKFLSILRGNPLYIKNIAKAAWRMGKKELAENDIIECYANDVSAGETAFYWNSIFTRYAKTPTRRRAMLVGLMNAIEHGIIGAYIARPALPELSDPATQNAVNAMLAIGMQPEKNNVFIDVIGCLYMKEVDGISAINAWDRITTKYQIQPQESCFEIVIPMTADAELVVAKAVEQIGKNINLDSDFLNYLQLALIEVCINAIEHSGSYENKVFVKFNYRADRLNIVVENAGRPFSLETRREIPVEEKLRMGMKRGWGFKLVNSIMDDVKVERINDRTRVILTKIIKAQGVNSS